MGMSWSGWIMLEKRIPFGNDRPKRRGQKQIPFGNDRQKGNGKNKVESRFPSGMTNKKSKCNG